MSEVKVFTNIFLNDIWDHAKRDKLNIAKKYKKQIQFINENINRIKPELIIEIGCGNNKFIEHTDVFNYPYLGIDIVKEQIEENIKKYPNRNYIVSKDLDYVKNLKKKDIPSNTLFLIKDVIQHQSNEHIGTFMKHLKRLRVKAIYITDRRGAWRCRRGVETAEERNLNNKYHNYPINYELEPMGKYIDNVVSVVNTNSGFKVHILYDFGL